jgi:hypothetical protein
MLISPVDLASYRVAVGIPVAWHPPHGSVRALISAYGSSLGYVAAKRYSAGRKPINPWDTRAPLWVGCVGVSYSDHYAEQGISQRLMQRLRAIAVSPKGYAPVLAVALRS